MGNNSDKSQLNNDIKVYTNAQNTKKITVDVEKTPDLRLNEACAITSDLQKLLKEQKYHEVHNTLMTYSTRNRTAILYTAVDRNYFELAKFMFPSKNEEKEEIIPRDVEPEIAVAMAVSMIELSPSIASPVTTSNPTIAVIKPPKLPCVLGKLNANTLTHNELKYTSKLCLMHHIVIQCGMNPNINMLKWILDHDRIPADKYNIKAYTILFYHLLFPPTNEYIVQRTDECLEILWSIDLIKQELHKFKIDPKHNEYTSPPTILLNAIKNNRLKWVKKLLTLDTIVKIESETDDIFAYACASTPFILRTVLLEHINIMSITPYVLVKIIISITTKEKFDILVKTHIIDAVLVKLERVMEIVMKENYYTKLGLLFAHEPFVLSLTYDLKKWGPEFLRKGHPEMLDILLKCKRSDKFQEYYRAIHGDTLDMEGIDTNIEGEKKEFEENLNNISRISSDSVHLSVNDNAPVTSVNDNAPVTAAVSSASSESS